MSLWGSFFSRKRSNSFLSKLSTALFKDHPGISGLVMPSFLSSQKHWGHSKKNAIFDLLTLKGSLISDLYKFDLIFILFKLNPFVILSEVFPILTCFGFHVSIILTAKKFLIIRVLGF